MFNTYNIKQGAGKSHTMKEVASKKLFPLESYIIIDPDETRSHFPEYHLYAVSLFLINWICL